MCIIFDANVRMYRLNVSLCCFFATVFWRLDCFALLRFVRFVFCYCTTFGHEHNTDSVTESD